MLKKILFLFPAVCVSMLALAQTPPTLPTTSTVVTCLPNTSSYTVITVGPAPGDNYTNLQTAIDAAPLGSILVLDAGATFYGNFTLPNKTTGSGWIIITGSAMNTALPAENNRVDPTISTQLN